MFIVLPNINNWNIVCEWIRVLTDIINYKKSVSKEKFKDEIYFELW
jgi:hypothetical protein